MQGVYVVKADRFYKIGQSKDIDARLATIRSSMPFQAILFHSIECENRWSTEAVLHERYDHRRINGEWFELTDDEANEILAMSEDECCIPTAALELEMEGPSGNMLRKLLRPEDIKAIRVAVGMSPVQFSRALGTTEAAVSRWESGQRHPRYEMMDKIHDLYQSHRPARKRVAV